MLWIFFIKLWVYDVFEGLNLNLRFILFILRLRCLELFEIVFFVKGKFCWWLKRVIMFERLVELSVFLFIIFLNYLRCFDYFLNFKVYFLINLFCFLFFECILMGVVNCWIFLFFIFDVIFFYGIVSFKMLIFFYEIKEYII